MSIVLFLVSLQQITSCRSTLGCSYQQSSVCGRQNPWSGHHGGEPGYSGSLPCPPEWGGWLFSHHPSSAVDDLRGGGGGGGGKNVT